MPATAVTTTAVVHEWIQARAGSELVFEALGQAFGDADLYVLTRDRLVQIDTGGRPVRTTILQRRPFVKMPRQTQLPLMPPAWKYLRRPSYDRVISSSHAFARWFARPDERHYSYVHTPMRYAWNPELDARVEGDSPMLDAGRATLKRLDLATVDGVHSFAGNSRAVAERIALHYDRDARVIHPPVDVAELRRFAGAERGAPSGDYLMTASRFVGYKKLDLAIEAAGKTGMPLVVAGTGPEEANLRRLAERVAPGLVDFVIDPPRSVLFRLVAGARAFLFPAHEDFGIIAVEAQAVGTPVIGLAAGGSLDTIVPGVTGRLAAEQTLESFLDALENELEDPCSPDVCVAHAQGFSRSRFIEEVVEWTAS